MTEPVPVFLLKWGTKYCAADVNRLTRSIRRHADRSVNILLFTDDPAGVDGVNVFRLPADENLIGWWWKVWLFSAGIPFLYLDLDCVVVGDITSLHRPDRSLTILKDPWQAGFNSSVMSTDGSLTRIWQSFKVSNAMKEMHGDQDWITEQVPDAALYQDGLCRSFKAEMQEFDRPPADCRLVYFHGKPKPLDALMRGASWIRDEWGVPA
ncbi:hypothetical protein LAC81_07665 [Ensifer adhaerens]|uniref:hypothetical protein n=1 Tax=Ensifer adhaerens TaxID=106592 RepID=UPI001CBC7EEB|nr:hypothetical protein [Ensifer adhaerens]MBZ7921657.1 hypothetical protein [Ensifer adhaerens]UAX94072.1 hypothetical protein LAC78_07660 [Ensifer adhaerens]UAY01706.1 hypothetical protein LAC80_07665 [Ensifer adhaerens]UAY09090.1 hypothetical protein LAC81_07665 [Ensifer adhaerens]